MEFRLIECTGDGETIHEHLQYREAPFLTWKTVGEIPLITLEDQLNEGRGEDIGVPDYGIN